MFKAQLNDPVAAGASSFIDQKKIGLRQRKSAPYKYKGLRTPQVRLLKLLPGRFGTSIHILFESKSLIESSIPQYEALSYAWGPSDNPEDIYIGISEAHVLSVTQNLACALQHIRYEDRPRTLWIDAISVDQSNLTERSSQVQRMADIFKLAERVLVWLGPERDNSSFALKILRTLSTKVDVDLIRLDMKPSDDAKSNGETHWSDMSVALPYTSKELIPVHHILQRSWFERLWIRQEVRLAYRAVVICGFDIIPWQDFRNAVYCLQNKQIALYHLVGTSEKLFLDRCDMIYDLCAYASSQSITSLIEEAQKCECSDPKDRIYGILGMLSENDQALKIIPDYRKSIGQVYQDFFLSYLDSFKYRSLLWLSWCEMRDHRSELPSWVPDLSQKRISTSFVDMPIASGISVAEVEYTGEGSLKVLGVKVTTISDDHQIHIHDPYVSGLAAAIRQCVPPGGIRNGGELFEKYCRTICGDNFQHRYDPPPNFLASWYESKKILRTFLGPQEDVGLRESQDLVASRVFDSVFSAMEHRSFISTEAGHIGLAPLLAKAEDEVVVIPGCLSPMVLRPMDDGRYQVVGECFILGLMDGEALLGPLPERYERIIKLHEENNFWRPAYRDRRTGQVEWTDPRFNLFRSEVQENGIRGVFVGGSESEAESVNDNCGVWMKTSSLDDAEEVIVMGVDLKPFELI
jgi:hypothetical protein